MHSKRGFEPLYSFSENHATAAHAGMLNGHAFADSCRY